MANATSYLLVEGVNIYDNLLDTDQLSVIRGGSFLLKDAINDIRENFKGRLTALSSGASSGLFAISGKESDDDLVEELVAYLRNHTDYRFLPFIVVTVQAEDLLEAKERLLTQLRFRQLQSPVHAPDQTEDGKGSRGIPCELEGRRVAAWGAERKVQGDKPRQLSLSVLRRLEHGRAMRQNHYFRSDGRYDGLNGYRFTDDFETLAKCEDQGVLDGKLAVIYADGNKFSKIQREYLQSRQPAERSRAQQEFDKHIQTLRNDFLKGLLLEMVEESRFPDAIAPTTDENGVPAIRCETLLWGGDEFQFVLPAWQGLEFVQYFFEKTRDWQTSDGTPLTHALGIVFCHAKSPIRVIGELARNLAEEVKTGLGDDPRRNAWDYIVLESIDYPTNTNIEKFMAARYKGLARSRRRYLLPAKDWSGTTEEWSWLTENGLITRRQLYRIADAISTGISDDGIGWNDLTDPEQALPESASEQSKREQRMFRLLPEEQRMRVACSLEAIARDLMGRGQQGKGPLDHAAGRAWFWVHLIELWDYWLRQEMRG